jgi:hypothetical protein
LFKVEGKLGTVVATVRLGEETKIAVFVLRELGVKCLKEIPDPWGCGEGRGGIVSTVTETSANGLINVKLQELVTYSNQKLEVVLPYWQRCSMNWGSMWAPILHY